MKEKASNNDLPKSVFVEPKNVFTNEALCKAIIDSGGNPIIEKIKYKGKIVPTLEMSTDLVKEAYASVSDLNKLKFKTYRKIGENKYQLFELLKPRKRTGRKISKYLLKKIKERQVKKHDTD